MIAVTVPIHARALPSDGGRCLWRRSGDGLRAAELKFLRVENPTPKWRRLRVETGDRVLTAWLAPGEVLELGPCRLPDRPYANVRATGSQLRVAGYVVEVRS